jgi:hypothetical protein
LSDMKIIKTLLEFYLLSACRALEFYCRVFLIILKKGILMSLEFYCRWSSTVAYKEIFKNYLKYWGSIFVLVKTPVYPKS